MQLRKKKNLKALQKERVCEETEREGERERERDLPFTALVLIWLPIG